MERMKSKGLKFYRALYLLESGHFKAVRRTIWNKDTYIFIKDIAGEACLYVHENGIDVPYRANQWELLTEDWTVVSDADESIKTLKQMHEEDKQELSSVADDIAAVIAATWTEKGEVKNGLYRTHGKRTKRTG